MNKDILVKRDRLYTFEQYCKERWGLDKSTVIRKIKATEMAEYFGGNCHQTNEGQLRALMPTYERDPDLAREIYEEAYEDHGGSH